ncbi:MAG: glutamate synthase central domain-containing protein, partial [bacterium]
MGYCLDKKGLYEPAFEHDSCGVGFAVNIKGEQSNSIVIQGLEILRRLSHRGAVGADPKTGDGAGIMMQIPHRFFAKVCKECGIHLLPLGQYGTGLIFLPTDEAERKTCKDILAKFVKEEGQEIIGWRRVPVDTSDIGKTAKNSAPYIEQVFIARSSDITDQKAFEIKLYLIRKQVEKAVRDHEMKGKNSFYINSLSSYTFTYKGLFMPDQLDKYFEDLRDKEMESAIALVHSRYSTNTFPTWDLAQPFRYLAHNGEINTLRGNINWMRAREASLQTEIFGKDIDKLKPVIVEGGSDSAAIDNVFELLVLSGRSMPHAMMMLIPGAWEHHTSMNKKLKDFYRYHSAFMEPWDGPAAIAFTDGVRIGAVLDRNGLRPARYIVTKSNMVIMASEVGVLDIPADDIESSGRLEPGKIFFIDTDKGKIVDDEAVKESISNLLPYGEWLEQEIVELEHLPKFSNDETINDPIRQFKAFGYSREDMKVIIQPMAEKAKEPVGSMGNDTPYAFLSKKPQLLFNYFRQLFAQVTNPAIDPIREEMVMSLESMIGPQGNILSETPQHVHKLKLDEPILVNEDLEKIRHIQKNSFKAKTISLLYKVKEEHALQKALERICQDVVEAIEMGYTFIILSDRGVDESHASIPALLAVSTLHLYLVKKTLRTKIGLILESGEPREVHHCALLFGYGVDAVNPYLAYEAIAYMLSKEEIVLDAITAINNYRKALH